MGPGVGLESKDLEAGNQGEMSARVKTAGRFAVEHPSLTCRSDLDIEILEFFSRHMSMRNSDILSEGNKKYVGIIRRARMLSGNLQRVCSCLWPLRMMQ